MGSPPPNQPSIAPAIGFEAHRRAGVMVARAAASGRLAHAYLLVGPQGIGKLRAALAFGRLAACHAPVESDGFLRPCERCASCILPFEPDRHHDLLLVDPAVSESFTPGVGAAQGREMKLIDRLRDAQARLSLGPLVARRKVLVIARLDSLQPVQMSVLLKTIEEPPGGGLLILTACNPSALLPTILSRCQVVEMAPAPTEVVLSLLERDDDHAYAAAALSAGKPEVARRLLASPDLDALVDNLTRLCRLAFAGRPLEALRAADLARKTAVLWYDMVEGDESAENGSRSSVSEEEKLRRSVEAVLFPLEALVRDALRDEVGSAAAGLTPSLLRSPVEVHDAAKALREVARAKKAIAGNANGRLALEALFLGLASA